MYSSELEQRISDCFEGFAGRTGSTVSHVIRHRGSMLALLRGVRRLPLLRVELPSTVQGAAIRTQLHQAWARRTVLAGVTSVLGLPDIAADYSRGSASSRYTLRKRSSDARRLGVQIELIDSEDERSALCAVADAYERVNPRPLSRNASPANHDMLGHRFWFVARVDDRPVLLAVLPAEGTWAAVRYFRTLEESEAATLSRYLMMQEIVATLVSHGVRLVVVGLGPHRMASGVRQFQRMMGFRIVRLVIAAPVSHRVASRQAICEAAQALLRRAVRDRRGLSA